MGHLYLISAGAGLQKVGRSSNPEKRLRSFVTSSPMKLELCATMEVDDDVAAERVAHRLLRPRRVHGEWFAVSLLEAEVAISFAYHHTRGEDFDPEPWMAPMLAWMDLPPAA